MKHAPVRGIHAPSPRVTPLAAALVALTLALPTGGVLTLIDLLFRR